MRVSKEGFVTRTLRREALQVLILSALRVCVCVCVRACVVRAFEHVCVCFKQSSTRPAQ